jgi:hypothetical protein
MYNHFYHTPIIQNTDRAACSEFFYIRLSTDVSCRCSDILEDEYKTQMKNMRVNSSLQAILGEDYLEFIKNLFAINMSSFSERDLQSRSCFQQLVR